MRAAFPLLIVPDVLAGFLIIVIIKRGLFFIKKGSSTACRRYVVHCQAMTVCFSIGRLPSIIVIILGNSIWVAAIVTTTIRITTIMSEFSSFFDKKPYLGRKRGRDEAI